MMVECFIRLGANLSRRPGRRVPRKCMAAARSDPIGLRTIKPCATIPGFRGPVREALYSIRPITIFWISPVPPYAG